MRFLILFLCLQIRNQPYHPSDHLIPLSQILSRYSNSLTSKMKHPSFLFLLTMLSLTPAALTTPTEMVHPRYGIESSGILIPEPSGIPIPEPSCSEHGPCPMRRTSPVMLPGDRKNNPNGDDKEVLPHIDERSSPVMLPGDRKNNPNGDDLE